MPTPKIVLITGCSRGLGRAMVDAFVKRGWTVAGCSRTAVDDLAAAHPAPHLFKVCDVTDDAAVQAFCAEVIDKLGPPDLVLNNAGVINRSAPLWEVPVEEFNRVMAVNIQGPANIMRHVLPAMMKRGSGVVANFSSGWGRSTSEDVAPYCATKWAIEGLSQATAQDTGGKVAIVPLNPGIIDTGMLRTCFGQAAGDYPGPEAWAEKAVPYLISLGRKDNGRPATVPQ